MIFKKSLYLGGKKRCPTHWNPLWNAVHELCFYMWKFVNSYRSLDPSATISKPSSFKSIIISAESSELLADAKFSRAFFELREHCCFFFCCEEAVDFCRVLQKVKFPSTTIPQDPKDHQNLPETTSFESLASWDTLGRWKKHVTFGQVKWCWMGPRIDVGTWKTWISYGYKTG